MPQPPPEPKPETSALRIPLGDITVLPNPRKRIGDLSELTASIQHHGVQQPILVRPAKSGQATSPFELVFGQRRYLASVAAKLPDIPARVEELTDSQVLERKLIENGKRSAKSTASRSTRLPRGSPSRAPTSCGA